MAKVTYPRAIEFASVEEFHGRHNQKSHGRSSAGRRVVKGGGVGNGGRPAGSGGSIKGQSTGSIKASDLKAGDKVRFGQAKREVSSVGTTKGGRVAVSFKDGGITDLKPSQSLPKQGRKVRVPAGSAAGQMKTYDKKFRSNPNNPANQMRHPDADRPTTGKIVRVPAKKAVTTWKNNSDRTTVTNPGDLRKRVNRMKDYDAGYLQKPRG